MERQAGGKPESRPDAWDRSYANRDNFVFQPQEEVIRFVSRYFRKRVGLDEFADVTPLDAGGRLLDLGCGIGRHVVFGYNMGFDAYGIDLSSEALKMARKYLEKEQVPDIDARLQQGGADHLPWADGYFDCVVSCGVLDSMPFEIARMAVREVSRVIKPDGLFYCDVISGDDSGHAREYAGEEVVETRHENQTIQSYFNFQRLKELVEPMFGFEECVLTRKENVLNGSHYSRYYVTLRPAGQPG